MKYCPRCHVELYDWAPMQERTYLPWIEYRKPQEPIRTERVCLSCAKAIDESEQFTASNRLS
jgi:hypothetical protein